MRRTMLYSTLAVYLLIGMMLQVGVFIHQATADPLVSKAQNRLMRFAEELDLTEAQKEGIVSAVVRFRLDNSGRRQALCEARKDLSAALKEEKPEETAVRQAYRNLAAIREEMLASRAAMLVEVRPLLTPEQRELLREKLDQLAMRFPHRTCGLGS